MRDPVTAPNSYQRTALERHCRFAFETAHEVFRHLVANGGVSIVLTVNSGYE